MPSSRICCGTSTFVAGRLNPNKESEPGISALRAAIVAGVELIHSNPTLQTQWAIRKALDGLGSPSGIRHLVKIETPIDADDGAIRHRVDDTVRLSCETLNVKRLHALIVEIDLKRSANRKALVDPDFVSSFYRRAADAGLATGRVDSIVAYCHSPAHIEAGIACECVRGIAAQYNSVEVWPTYYLKRIASVGRWFFGMSPLRRGSLVAQGASRAVDRLKALRWTLARPEVDAVVVTMSSEVHVREILDAASAPLSPDEIDRDVQQWRAAIVSDGKLSY